MQLKCYNIVLYGLFVICFTNVFYMLFDRVVRPEKQTIPRKNTVWYALNIVNVTRSNLFESTSVIQRSQRVAEYCETLGVNEKLYNNSQTVSTLLFLYNQSKICACDVPKAASTSLKRALLQAEFPENAEYYRRLPGYRLHTLKESIATTSDGCFNKMITSFFVTRDPYTRLYSAYIDKIFLAKFHSYTMILDAAFKRDVQIDTIKDMALNKNEEFDSVYCRVPNVTFEQFLEVISTSTKLDPHFAPVTMLCKPCINRFSFILKQESLADDLSKIIGAEDNINSETERTLNVSDYFGELGIEGQIMSFYTHWNSWLASHQCVIDEETYYEINGRIWDGLKALGSIDENLEFIEELFEGPSSAEKLKLRNPESILYEFKANKVPFLNKEQRDRQRHKYLQNAYRSVSKSVIQRIQQMFQFDFQLFDYDPVPPGW